MDIPISENLKHAHRTAKVIELMGASTKSFEDAIRHALEDASATTRGITGAHVQNMSVRCENGKITEYKVDLKVAFGIERTAQP
ncbi:MAG: dodecin family protein [Candidatus Thermoplasmatota archaeon]|nr:dodecin family protein [Candidatus Thermoplasmatota archaeon]